VMTVLITDTGQVEQRLIDVSAELDEEFLGQLGTGLNSTLGGVGLAEAAEKLVKFADQFPADREPAVGRIASALIEQVLATRQDKLVMAGTANLVRTEEDFSGSIYPVLEAIEEQVTLLRLFGEMEPDHNGFSASIGKENASFGLGETSVLATGYATSGGGVSRLGVIGPTRMDYSNNIAAVRAVARYLSRLLGED
jgi:heat-inducible transcriptional repressor